MRGSNEQKSFIHSSQAINVLQSIPQNKEFRS